MKPATYGAGTEKNRKELPKVAIFPDNAAILWDARKVLCSKDAASDSVLALTVCCRRREQAQTIVVVVTMWIENT